MQEPELDALPWCRALCMIIVQADKQQTLIFISTKYHSSVYTLAGMIRTVWATRQLVRTTVGQRMDASCAHAAMHGRLTMLLPSQSRDFGLRRNSDEGFTHAFGDSLA